jgi:hypothetical protein
MSAAEAAEAAEVVTAEISEPLTWAEICARYPNVDPLSDPDDDTETEEAEADGEEEVGGGEGERPAGEASRRPQVLGVLIRDAEFASRVSGQWHSLVTQGLFRGHGREVEWAP